ncbi:GH92 family glycosyl hydrolase [[Flexibacter] sp. ATCC 35208]|uniref:GH92 family glycosyl hydrolase n=1 Tax=[Flexibacter] sp. ATCC 35208 TaxID=1936242 RepID=UPI0015C35012|nr:GH92 family glycosyl hydrolase [[Flexibacter] sp. ATCC 35208]
MLRKGLMLCSLLYCQSLFADTTDLVRYVNTLQGTNSSFTLTRGNTYPTTALPFGMHTWTPQTGKNGDGWKYQYEKDSIRGFQQAHQCSSWSNDYCVFSLMPVTGTLAVNQFQRAARFSHKNEIAKPNYYKVTLDNKITTEIAPTERGAHLRFTFPRSGDAWVVLDGYTRISNVKIIPAERKIIGYINNGQQLSRELRSYFVLQFDQPFTAYGVWDSKTGTITADTLSGKNAYIKFKKGAVVQVKAASSYISQDQAELNLQRELGSFASFDQTKAAAWKVWNDYLGKVKVEGGTPAQKATFYSCFFRASLFSRQFFEYDKDGLPYYYSPYDDKVHAGYLYTDTGFWDTFRAQFPLNALLHPTMHGRYVAALLDAYDQCGWLPSWSFPGEGGSMIGNHAISLLADAWAKGLHTFDPQKALKAYLHEATNKGPWGPANGRDGWKEYYTLGYVPYPGVREATAKTLEYAYDDFCGYTLAKETGNTFCEGVFSRQMYNYKNVWDSVTGFMRGREADGSFKADFDPIEWGGPFTEGNAWHWQWSVFHDIQGLINLMGGDSNFVHKLDAVFASPNNYKVGTYGGPIHEMTEMVMANMGQYAHGNQPIQHMVYLYNYAGQPWKSQYWARAVMEKLYNATENGYPGDEDQGQTSSWYVLSALGFYSVCPGTDQYVMGSPVFNKTTIILENGKQFVIEANNNSMKNVYIKSATLNGQVLTKDWLSHTDITNGGILHLEMSDQPERSRGIAITDRPFSLTK